MGTYSADDSVMSCEMGLAVLASEDFVGVEVDVVGESHFGLLLFVSSFSLEDLAPGLCRF